MCSEQEPCRLVKGQVHSLHLNFVHRPVKSVPARPITLLCIVGFKNKVAQTRQCVMNKNDVARSKVKVAVCTYTLCIDFSENCMSPTHNLVMHGGI